MSYQCANCRKVFAESEAKCDDWLDDKRNLICPYCDVALIPAARHSVKWQHRIKRINYQHIIWVLGFFFALVLVDRTAGLPLLFPYVASFLALMGVLFYGWFAGSGPEPTETVDIILEKAESGNVYEFKPHNHDETTGS